MYLDLQSKLCALRVAFGRKRSAGFSTHSPTSGRTPTRTSTHEALNGGVLAGTLTPPRIPDTDAGRAGMWVPVRPWGRDLERAVGNRIVLVHV
jgi:hypothetical protein